MAKAKAKCHTITLTEAELRAAVRAFDIAITVSQGRAGQRRPITFRPLGRPDGAETAAAKRVLRRLLELHEQAKAEEEGTCTS